MWFISECSEMHCNPNGLVIIQKLKRCHCHLRHHMTTQSTRMMEMTGPNTKMSTALSTVVFTSWTVSITMTPVCGWVSQWSILHLWSVNFLWWQQSQFASQFDFMFYACRLPWQPRRIGNVGEDSQIRSDNMQHGDGLYCSCFHNVYTFRKAELWS